MYKMLFSRPAGLGKILRNSYNNHAYYLPKHRIRCIYNITLRNKEKKTFILLFFSCLGSWRWGAGIFRK